MSAPLVAALDVGSLSVLLAVGRRHGRRGLLVLREASRVVRLAEGGSGALAHEAVERTLEAIRELAATARAEGASIVRAAGTAALREAGNAADLIQRARREARIDIEVVDAEREAALTLRGVWTGREGGGTICVVDVGGGSMEITVGSREGPVESSTLPFGALRLAARYPEARAGELTTRVGAALPDRPAACDPTGLAPVGVGGTITTLGALDLGLVPYDARRLEGHRLSRETIAGLRARLASTPIDARRRDPILERGRADVIVHGALVYEAVLERYRWDAIEISPRGLKEGLLAEMLDRAEGRR